MTEKPATKIQSVPSLWPLGYGLVLTSTSLTKRLGLVQLRAASDKLLKHRRETGAQPTDEDWEQAGRDGAPTLTLAFKDSEAVRKHIAMCVELAEHMEKEKRDARED